MTSKLSTVQRILAGSPLRHQTGGCLFVLVLVPLLGVAMLGHLTLWITSLDALGIAFVAATLGLVATLPAIALLWYLDRRERETIWMVISALLYGAVVSTGVSALLNGIGFGFISVGLDIVAGVDAQSLAELLAAALIAPPVEEAAKGLALIGLFWLLRAEFDNVRDGIVYGGLIGLGFNIAEYALYVMQGYLISGTAPFAEQLATRFVFLGINGHTLWTAIFGASLGYARQATSRIGRVLGPSAGYVVAVGSHALNNSVGIFLLALILTLAGFDFAQETVIIPPLALWLAAAIMNGLVQFFAYVMLAIALIHSARWERSIIRAQLANEVGGAVTPEEYALLRSDTLFSSHRLQRITDRRAAAIVNAQNELAFRKWHVARDGGQIETDVLVHAWRTDIKRLRTSV